MRKKITDEQRECLNESMEALDYFLTTKDRSKLKEWTKKWESKLEEWIKEDASFSDFLES